MNRSFPTRPATSVAFPNRPFIPCIAAGPGAPLAHRRAAGEPDGRKGRVESPGFAVLARVWLLLLACTSSGQTLCQTTSTWTAPPGPAGTSIEWDSPTAWSTAPLFPRNGQPAPGDTYRAVIDRVAGATTGPTVRIRTATTVNGLTLADGFLFGTAVATGVTVRHLAVNGPFVWHGGWINHTLTMSANGGIEIRAIPGRTPPTLGDIILTNAPGQTATHVAGLFQFADSSELLQDGGTFQNQGEFLNLGGTGIDDPSGTDRLNLFRNVGTFSSAAAAGTLYRVNVNFDNSGAVVVESGGMALLRGGTATGGQFDVPQGSTLEFRGPHVFDANTRFTGGGTILFGYDLLSGLNDTAQFAGLYNFPGHTIISNRTTTFAGTAQVAALTLRRGELGFPSNAVLTALGPITFLEGTIKSRGRVLATRGFTVADTGASALDGAELTNPSGQTSRFEFTGRMTLRGGARIINLGRIEATGRGSLLSSGTSNRVINDGVISRSSGTNNFTIDPVVVNRGTVSALAGRLTLNGVESAAGDFFIAREATLEFGGISTFDAETVIDGGGTASFSRGTHTFAGMYAFPGRNEVSSGTLQFLGPVRIPNLEQTGGSVQFNGASTIGSITRSSGTMVFLGSTTLGTVNQDGVLSTASLTFSNNAAITGDARFHAGVVNVAAGRTLTVDGLLDLRAADLKGPGTLEAYGGIALPAGQMDLEGMTLVNPAGSIARTPETLAGSMNFINGGIFDNQGTFLALNNSTLNLFAAASGANLVRNSGTFTRQGTAGNFTININFQNTGDIEVRSANLAFSATCAFTQDSGSFRLAGGTVSKAGGALRFNGGTLGGAGSLTGAVDMLGGTLTPGAPVGSLAINGNLTLGAAATIVLDIGGTGQGVQHDVVSEAGNAPLTLAGTLAVRFINGFESRVKATDSFTVISSSAALRGQFANVASGQRLATADGHGSFVVTYGGTSRDVVLSNFERSANPPVSLRITAFVPGPSTLDIEWSPVPGASSYTVQQSLSPAPASWTPVLAPVPAGTLRASIPRPATGHRFFRVVTNP